MYEWWSLCNLYSVCINLLCPYVFSRVNSILKCVRCPSFQKLSAFLSPDNKTPDFCQGGRGKLSSGMEWERELSFSNNFYPVFLILALTLTANWLPVLPFPEAFDDSGVQIGLFLGFYTDRKDLAILPS